MTGTLKSICDRRFWICRTFFILPGRLNDIDVIEASLLLENIVSEIFSLLCKYCIAAFFCNKRYSFSMVSVLPLRFSCTRYRNKLYRRKKIYAKTQEDVYKDFERAFNVL